MQLDRPHHADRQEQNEEVGQAVADPVDDIVRATKALMVIVRGHVPDIAERVAEVEIEHGETDPPGHDEARQDPDGNPEAVRAAKDLVVQGEDRELDDWVSISPVQRTESRFLRSCKRLGVHSRAMEAKYIVEPTNMA